MTEREKELRNKIRKECWAFEGNFSQIEILERMQNDWTVAQEDGNYKFKGCPSSYDCLSSFVGICESVDGIYIPEHCVECWKKALSGGDDI